jgi:hypothetical protein
MPRIPRGVGGRGGGGAIHVGPTRIPRPGATGRLGSNAPKVHRSFFGGLLHDVTHPGVAELPLLSPLAGLYAPFYLAGHTKKGKARTVGHVGQALIASPWMMAAHPKATYKDVKSYPVSAAEGVQALVVSPFEEAIKGTLPPMMGGTPRTRRTPSLAPSLPGEVTAVGSFTTRLKKAEARSAKVLLKATIADYKKRYGEDWKVEAAKDPTYNFADAMTIVGAAVPMAAGARAFTALTRAGELEAFGGRTFSELSAIQKAKALKMEYHEPGKAATGTAKTRKVSYTPPTGERVTAEQPFSRGPLRRGGQVVGDALSEAFPNAPVVGAARRVTKANAIKVARDLERTFASVPGVASFGKLSPGASTRLSLEGQLVNRPAHLMGNVDEKLHASDLAAHNEHVTSELKKLHEILSNDEYTLPPGPIRDAQADAFKQARLKEIEAAIKAKPDKHYHRAYEGAVYISNLNRHIHLDEAGFTAHANDLKRAQDRVREYEALDEAGKLDRPEKLDQAREDVGRIQNSLNDAIRGTEDVLDQRQGLLRRYVDVNRPGHFAPERASFIQLAKSRGIPDEQIAAGITAYDAVAANYPKGVEAWWRDKVGTSADSMLKHIAGRPEDTLFQDFPDFGDTSLIETREPGGTRPAATSAYYSRLQKRVSDAWGGKQYRQMGQVRKEMFDPQNVSPQERYNSGLDNFFNQYGPNDLISQDDLQEFLANPLNAYNLVERHRINTHEADIASGAGQDFGTGYGGAPDFGWRETLVSRSPDVGEYHEITFSLPGAGRDTEYTGTAMSHWGQPNIVGHVRFHVFEENGVRKLLIEEIQSDWGSDYRKAKKAGREYAPVTPEAEAEHQRLLAIYQERSRVAMDIGDEYDALTARYNTMHPEQGVEPDPDMLEARDALREQMNEVHNRYLDAQDEADRASVDAWASYPNDSGVPPPPLSANQVSRLGVNRVLRHAAENDVDQIIVVDRHVQHIRNHTGGFGYHLDWQDIAQMEPKAARAASTDLLDAETPYVRIYENDIPKQIRSMTGEDSQYVENAYHGHYATQSGAQGPNGDIAGTVFQFGEDAKRKALRPTHLYQRQPDWMKLPKGAAEFLGDGKSRVHLFENADLSTMMHELFHIAMPDMEDEHRAVLEGYYGSGKTMDEWTATEHENAARDFERWLREGASPNRLVAAAFQRIGQWMRDLFGKLKEEGKPIPQDIQDAFGSLFAEQRTAPEDIPDFYMPHRSRASDVGGVSTSRGVPRANRDIGDYVPSREPLYKRNDLRLLRSGLINFDPRLLIDHMNRLVMLQRSNNIREFLLEHAEPMLPGDVPDTASQYVIKKAGTGTDQPLYDALEGADNPEALRQTIRQHAEDYLTDDQQKIDLWRDQESRRLGSGRARQLYKIDKKFVDDLMVQLTGKTPGAATRNRGAGALALVDAALDTQRGLLLYGNPGFYTANMLGNAFMLSISDPRAWRSFRWAFDNGMKQAVGTGAEHRWQRIAGEMGRGRTSGPLSQQDLFFEEKGRVGSAIQNIRKPRRGESRAELMGRGVSRGWHRVGQHAGAIVDDTFRTMAWKQSARKRGIKTDAEIDKLLNDAVQRDDMAAREAAQKKLHAIRDEAEQLMLDFDSMSAFEKSWLTRFVFLYPFIRASLKYPFIFAGERPLTTAAMMQAGRIGQEAATQVLGPRPEGLPEWADTYARMFGGYMPIGSMAPTQPLADILGTATNIGQSPITGINTLFGMQNPLTQTVIEALQGRNQYGRPASAPSIFQSELALPPWMAQLLLQRQPSRLYRDRGFLDTLLRSSRVYPFQVNEDYGSEITPSG